MENNPFFDMTQLSSGADKMINLVKEIRQKDHERLVCPNVQPGFLRKNLKENAPEQGTAMDNIIQDTKNIYYPGVLNWESPRFFAYFPSLNQMTAIIAQIFTISFHTPGFMYAMSPSHTQLENVMVDWTTKALGLPDRFLLQNQGGAIINQSVSESIVVMVHAAKKRKMKELNLQMISPEVLKFVGYYAEFSHPGAQKALYFKDIYYRRPVPVKFCQIKGNYILNIQKFKEIVQEDMKSGLIPFFYGITHGSTFNGASDYCNELLEVCEKYKIWTNVDAAYLGSSWICPQHRIQQNLLQRVDSLCLNFSKTLFMGVGGSLMFVKNKKQFTESMTTSGQSSFSFYNNKFTGKNDVVDYKPWIIGANRRSSSLRFYFLYKYYGLQRLRIYVRQIFEKAKFLTKLIEQNNQTKLFSRPQYGLVCFQICRDGKADSELTKMVVKKIANCKEGFLTPAQFQGNHIIRLAIGNQETTKEIIQSYLNKIVQAINRD